MQSVRSSVGLSFLIVAYIVASETLHLTLRSPYVIADLDTYLVNGIALYAVISSISGVIVGLVTARPHRQAFLLAGLWYVLVSLKIFGLDAELLTRLPIALAFVAFTACFFVASVYVVRRFSLAPVFPVLLIVAYANICLGIASGWALSGGKLGAFLLSPRTLGVIAVGAVALVGTTLLYQRLAARARHAVLGALFLAFAIVIVATQERLPVRRADSTSVTRTEPDVYVLSLDALRYDVFQEFIAQNPDGQLAAVARHGTSFVNVVSHGLSTDDVLRNNTFSIDAPTRCAGSLPDQMAKRGYFTAMMLGRSGRRFEGSTCFQYYFSGGGKAALGRYTLPALLDVFSRSDEGLRAKALPANVLIDQLRDAANTAQPLFAYLHFVDMHAPYVPASKRRDSDYIASLRRYMQTCYLVACDPAANAPLIATMRAAYEEVLGEMDVIVREAFSIARRRNRDFVVIVTADHGELFGEHGGYAHSGGFFPELLHVPFVVFDSRRTIPQRRCELILTSEVLMAASREASGASVTYADRRLLAVTLPPLGRAELDKARNTLRYELSDSMPVHAGTWRNVHKDRSGTFAYPVEKCAGQQVNRALP